MDDIVLDDITYGTTGWNGLAQANFEKIETYINYMLHFVQLEPDRIICLDNRIICLDNRIIVMEEY